VRSSPSGPCGRANEPVKRATAPRFRPGTNIIGAIKQIDGRPANVGNAEAGSRRRPRGPFFLHGWPYDIHTYVVRSTLLARPATGARPYLRGYAHAFSFERYDAQRPAVAVAKRHLIALMDSPQESRRRQWLAATGRAHRNHGVLVGRSAASDGLRSVILIGKQEARQKMPLPPKAELQWWYQFYFPPKRGRAGYDKYRHDFAKLIGRSRRPMAFRRCHLRSQCGGAG